MSRGLSANPPPFTRGMKVGLFGGSFNPPHEGHRAASLLALRRLDLDRIWWLVSPANPLKDPRELAPLSLRVEEARKISRHPRIEVSAVETAIGARYSFETVAYLKRRCPGVRFVWLMGADSFRSFDRWQRWQSLAQLLPIAVIDRPGWTFAALQGAPASVFAPYRFDERDGRCFSMAIPLAILFLHGPRSPCSSTQLRGSPLHKD
ncbi:MAG TPA: nicotinate-nucleotide adenylyltransferase [Methylocella sp.]|nr:nicotinate-nucleotide adenylyltransferase [Methylocella sp.]